MTRRPFIKSLLATSSMMSVHGLVSAELQKTQRMGEGPFYPDKFPLDTDNDLVKINSNGEQASGEITYLSGKLLDIKGKALSNFEIEIWQVDNNGVYLHSGSANKSNHDPLFQGFGRTITNQSGEFYFRTIKPVDYPGRVPHIHVAVNLNNKRLLTTQLLVKGNPKNAKDGLFRRVKSDSARESVLADYKQVQDLPETTWEVRHDLVLGQMPEAK